MKVEAIFTELSRSRRAANAVAKSIPNETLDGAIKNLQAAKQQIEKKLEARAAKARSANIKKLKAMMAELGICIEDLRAEASKAKSSRLTYKQKQEEKTDRRAKKRRKIPAKYSIVLKGTKHQWTGRGRMPLVFKEHIQSGGSLEACLIEKS